MNNLKKQISEYLKKTQYGKTKERVNKQPSLRSPIKRKGPVVMMGFLIT